MLKSSSRFYIYSIRNGEVNLESTRGRNQDPNIPAENGFFSNKSLRVIQTTLKVTYNLKVSSDGLKTPFPIIFDRWGLKKRQILIP